MKRNSFSILVILALLLSLLPLGQARAQSGDITIHLDQVDVSNFPNITVHLNAWDAAGLPLGNLTATDFELQEDTTPAFPPLSIEADSQAQLAVALVLDTSGSMAGKPLTDAKSAAARFLDRLKPGDQAALLAFSSPVNPDPANLASGQELAFTSDLGPVYNLVEGLSAGGNTALYNAAAKAVRMTDSLPLGHRAILLLSDGNNDPANVGNPDEAIQLAKQANIPFFVIGLGDQIDAKYLQRLAIETGGFFRAAPSSSELARLFTDTATQLKTQYKLTFKSALKPDGARHALTIRLKQSGAQTQANIQFGPLPAAPQITASPQPVTPTPTMLAPAPVTPEAVLPALVPPVVPTDAPPPPPFLEQYGLWLAGALLALILLIALIVFLLRRQKKEEPPVIKEVCAYCGHDMTNESGACPVCKRTTRAQKTN